MINETADNGAASEGRWPARQPRVPGGLLKIAVQAALIARTAR